MEYRFPTTDERIWIQGIRRHGDARICLPFIGTFAENTGLVKTAHISFRTRSNAARGDASRDPMPRRQGLP